jgi:RNA polymerase sigma-70 factor (ECF subfamily)
MDEFTDRILVERSLRGDVDAYGELVRRYQTSVFNVCYRLMGERQGAEDQTQEAFMRAYRRLETFDVGRPFGPWIRQVGANLCLNELRGPGQYDQPFEEEQVRLPQTAWEDPERRVEHSERSEAIRRALLELPSHYRAVIELRHFGGLSYKEIGRALGLPLSQVRTHLYRARNALAELLEDEAL